MILISSTARIWIATGHTDMRKGMQGSSLLVQESLGSDPFAGDVFVFRGCGSSLIKTLWHDGIGLSLTFSCNAEKTRKIEVMEGDERFLLKVVSDGSEERRPIVKEPKKKPTRPRLDWNWKLSTGLKRGF
jgi:transposase